MISPWSGVGIIIGIVMIIMSALMVGSRKFFSRNFFDVIYEIDKIKAKRAILLFMMGLIVIVYNMH
ncbi:MAG: hypothetical protein PF572_03410 [Patescibacteria group bacterium]|jgi:hypothetical protein|nr:hypothetical protein [Patescibacteria group bacterium]